MLPRLRPLLPSFLGVSLLGSVLLGVSLLSSVGCATSPPAETVRVAPAASGSTEPSAGESPVATRADDVSPSSPPPVTHLGVTARLTAISHVTWLEAAGPAGGAFLLGSSDSLALYRSTNWREPVWQVERSEPRFANLDGFLSIDGALFGSGRDRLVLFDVGTLSPRWKLAEKTASARAVLPDERGGVLVTAAAGAPLAHARAVETLRIDLGTGQVSWRRPGRALAAGAGRALLHDGKLRLLDAATAEEIQVLDVPGASEASLEITLGEGLVVVLAPGEEVRAFDAQTGNPLWTAAAGGAQPLAAPRVLGRSVLFTSWNSGASAFRIEAFRKHSGGRRFQSSPYAALSRPRVPLVQGGDDDAIYVTTPGGQLLALDANTGRELFRHGLGVAHGAVALANSSTGPAIAARASLGVLVFERQNEQTGLRRAQIAGRVMKGDRPAIQRRVQVGDLLTITDDRGHFSLALEGRGTLLAVSDVEAGREASDPVVVDLAAPPAELELSVRSCAGSCK